MPASKPAPEKGRLLMGEMKLGDVKSIGSLKKSGLTADFTISVRKSNIYILLLKLCLSTDFIYFLKSTVACVRVKGYIMFSIVSFLAV